MCAPVCLSVFIRLRVFILKRGHYRQPLSDWHNGGDEQGGSGHCGAAGGRDAPAIGPAGQSGAVQEKRGSQEGLRGGQAEGELLLFTSGSLINRCTVEFHSATVRQHIQHHTTINCRAVVHTGHSPLHRQC